jgi:hypothetical protein
MLMAPRVARKFGRSLCTASNRFELATPGEFSSCSVITSSCRTGAGALATGDGAALLEQATIAASAGAIHTRRLNMVFSTEGVAPI